MRTGAPSPGNAVAGALLAAGVLLFSSCRTEPEERPVGGGTAVLVSSATPATANPLVAADVYSQELTRALLYVPLLERDGELALTPRLAESWTLAGDTAAEFTLRRDLTWSDGRPVTAFDVAFTYRAALDTAGTHPGRAELAHLREVAATDSYTVRWRFRPVRDALAAATLPVLPAHALDTVPVMRMGSAAFNLAPVTSGPFRVLRGRPGGEWVLTRNPTFPAALGGPPLLDRLVWREVTETAAQLAELEAGEADVVVGLRPEAAAPLDSARFLLVHRPTLRYTTVAWNGRRPPLSDVRVRRALGHAIDRRAILDGLRQGLGAPAATPVPPGHWAYAKEAAPLQFDPAAARRLLDEAGLADRDGDGIRDLGSGGPLAVELLYPAESDFNRDLAQVLQSNLHEVGVRLEVRAVEFATLVGIITGADRDFDAVLLALDTDPRIDLRSLFHGDELAGPFQLAGFSLPELDAVLDTIDETVSREAARPLWARAQRLISEHQPWAFLYHGTETIAVRRPLRGVEADLRGVLWSAPHWWRPREQAPEER